MCTSNSKRCYDVEPPSFVRVAPSQKSEVGDGEDKLRDSNECKSFGAGGGHGVGFWICGFDDVIEW